MGWKSRFSNASVKVCLQLPPLPLLLQVLVINSIMHKYRMRRTASILSTQHAYAAPSKDTWDASTSRHIDSPVKETWRNELW